MTTLRFKADKHDQIRIAVSDTGAGLPEEFDIDLLASQAVASNGINLIHVNEIVRLHDGTLEAEDNEDRGATFIIEFPREGLSIEGSLAYLRGLNPGVERLYPKEKKNSQPFCSDNDLRDTPKFEKQDIKILVVEDDYSTRQSIVNCLSREGYSITEASNGMSASDTLEKEIPNLVVCDVFMPEMSGFEFARWMRGKKALRHIPVLFISGATEKNEH